MPDHDPQYVRASLRLLLTVWELNLPTPINTTWERPYGAPPRLQVHVEARHMRAWEGALVDHEWHVQSVGRASHVHVVGHLVGEDTRLHLLAVMDEAPEVVR